MPKFELGQAVKVVHGGAARFAGFIAKIEPRPQQFYRVESHGKDGRTYSMTVEEGWLEADNRPDSIDRCLIDSLKSLAFHIGGTHVAGMVEEAEKAAKEGKVIRYE
jgi:hypothetical protein